MLAQPNKAITLVANLGVGKTGLNTIGYTLYNCDGTTFQSRRTTGVAELPSGSGSYYVTLANTVFTTDFHGQIAWDEAIVPLVNEDITIEAIRGSSGDPLPSAVPGGYGPGTAGAALGLITASTKITVVSPVNTVTKHFALIQDVDYLAADGNAIAITFPWTLQKPVNGGMSVSAHP